MTVYAKMEPELLAYKVLLKIKHDQRLTTGMIREMVKLKAEEFNVKDETTINRATKIILRKVKVIR